MNSTLPAASPREPGQASGQWAAADRVAGASQRALTAALRRLDDVLGIAVDAQARLLGPATLLDPWRGMHLEQADVRRLLTASKHSSVQDKATGKASVPPIGEGIAELLGEAAVQVPRLAQAAAGQDLSMVDLAALLIILAADVDLRYERIYGYLQDDIARKRPALDFIANLLAVDVEQRVAVCARFRAGAPMLKSGLVVSHGTEQTPWLARAWAVDELWRNWFFGRSELDASLASCARLLAPRALELDAVAEPAVCALLQPLLATGEPAGLRLILQGPHGAGKLALAHALAYATRRQLLVVDARDWSTPAEVRAQLQRAGRAADLFGAQTFIHGTAGLAQREPQLLRSLVESLAGTQAGFVLGLAAPMPALHTSALTALRIDVNFPATPRRHQLWQRNLAALGLEADRSAVTRVAASFSLSAAQIEQAAADAATRAGPGAGISIGYAELAAAARAQSGAELAHLAQRITPEADFVDLVTLPELREQLGEICARVATRETVQRDWGAGSVHARATGVTVLFVGASGTGKTLAAEAVARELGLELYRIDLATIVSKYIGDTEKNLDRVFAAARHANAVLFFDEADALFGKRSEVKDAHDRYANIEIAYLLQKMEQFDGLAILATNLKQNLDEAFVRRLTFTVNFPFPEAAQRQRLWEQLWPPRAPRAPDVDLGWFAREFRLSGGNIRNTVLAAAHLAAADGQVVTREHLMHATRREFQKLGKSLVDPAVGVGGRVA